MVETVFSPLSCQFNAVKRENSEKEERYLVDFEGMLCCFFRHYSDFEQFQSFEGVPLALSVSLSVCLCCRQLKETEPTGHC